LQLLLSELLLEHVLEWAVTPQNLRAMEVQVPEELALQVVLYIWQKIFQ
jgi:predicted SPOUT superfamily RNA methylase MTH1